MPSSVKAEKKFPAGSELREAWAETLQEVLSAFSPVVFGKLPKLDWAKASCICSKGIHEIKVPITGRPQTRVRGLLGMREIKGHVYIRGARDGFTHIYLWDTKPECRAIAWAGVPVKEDIKRQLLTPLKRPENN